MFLQRGYIGEERYAFPKTSDFNFSSNFKHIKNKLIKLISFEVR